MTCKQFVFRNCFEEIKENKSSFCNIRSSDALNTYYCIDGVVSM